MDNQEHLLTREHNTIHHVHDEGQQTKQRGAVLLAVGICTILLLLITAGLLIRRGGESLSGAALPVAVAVLTVADRPVPVVVDVVVNTTYGPVQGGTIGAANYYLGIPFAAPPINQLRLSSPQPPTPWSDIRPALSFGNMCLQAGMGNEDCLFINVFQPSDIKVDERLPVMVWIYGGGFVQGASDYYPGTNLTSQHRNIIVTFNYRLGSLGFMALRTLQEGDPWHSTGNYGMADQVMALRWVQGNIEAFGGNKSHVTIAGESAGAISVCIHLVSPLSRGLFHGAIMESGMCDFAGFAQDLQLAINQTLLEARSMGCMQGDSQALVNCLRQLPASTLLGGGGPTIDGTLLTGVPLTLISSGSWAAVPLTIGANLDEGSDFVYTVIYLNIPGLHWPLIEQDLYVILDTLFNNNTIIIDALLALYPIKSYNSIFNLTANLLGDELFNCPSRRVVRTIDAVGGVSWLYHFTYLGSWDKNSSQGVAHGSEIAFVYDMLPWNATTNDRRMADTFGVYWSNFIKHGDPNRDEVVPQQWPAWTADSPLSLRIDEPLALVDNLLNAKCNLWDVLHATFISAPLSRIHRSAQRFNLHGSPFRFNSRFTRLPA